MRIHTLSTRTYAANDAPENLHPDVRRWQPQTARAPSVFPLGLGQEGVHEVCEARFGDMPALTGFALATAKPRRGAVGWISQRRLQLDYGSCLPAGLTQLQSESCKLVSIETSKLTDALWAIEEAIRSAALGQIIAEIGKIDFTASRRLALASGRHGVPVILLMPYTCEGSTAASARWRVSSRPSGVNRFDARGLGAPRWRAVLERSRRAPHMMGKTFDLELNDETLSLSVVSKLAAHAPSPCTPGNGRRDHADIRKSA